MSFVKIVPDTNNKRVLIQIAKSGSNVKHGIRKGLHFFGRDLKRTSQNGILRGPKTGRIYRRPIRRRSRYRASAPGEYPKNVTGNLRHRMGFKVEGSSRLVFGNTAKYARRLEQGGTDLIRNFKIEPRPFLKKSILSNQIKGKKHIEREINNAIKGA